MAKSIPQDIQETINDSKAHQAQYNPVKALALKYTKPDKAQEVANKLSDVIHQDYQEEATHQAIEEITKLADRLEAKNSDFRRATILNAFDEVFSRLHPNITGTKKAKMAMLRTERGAIKANSRENVRLIFEHDFHFQDLFRYNEFTDEVEYRKDTETGFVPADDGFLAELAADIERYYRTPFPDAVIEKGLLLAAKSHPFNPIKERIESVKWDGKPRAATFFIDYLGADNNDYVKAVTETWLVALIARAYHPGVKCDIMPILDGKQGIGKSTLVSLLCPPSYFDDNLKTMGSNKDDLIKLHRAWIVEIGELEAMLNTSLDQTKAFLSATSDNYRAPYGRLVERHPRKNMFIGTVNRSEYLHDLTGNRRFYPIHCEKEKAIKTIPNPSDANNADILQILAEAKVLYDQGHPLFLPNELEKIAHDKQAEAMTLDPQAELMIEYSELLVPDDWDDFSIYQRNQYWKRYKEKGEYSHYKSSGETGHYVQYRPDQLTKMGQFATTELLEVVFERDGKEVGRGGRNSLTAKLPMVFGNNDQWKKSDNCTLLGKRRKGYKRVIPTR